jgi:superfamily I DNA and/or RNA helicase
MKMLVGNPRQLRPLTLFEPYIQLPFYSQLQISLLERIVDSSKVDVALNTCYRQFADLGVMMSRVIYYGSVRFSQDQWNTTAIAVNGLLPRYLGPPASLF